MEFLFFWFNDDYQTLENTGLSLSSRFIFNYDKNNRKKAFELKVEKNPTFIEGFFAENVQNISAIIGDNGVGKTNILGLISDFLTTDYLFFRNWVVAFWNVEKEKIELYYDLYYDEENNKYDPNWELRTIREKDINIEEFKIQHKNLTLSPPAYNHFPKLNKSKVIQYSPILDFRNYPPKKNLEDNPFDVSTNYLIYGDSRELHDSDLDKIQYHKHKNIERQIELSNSNLAKLNELNIPTEVEVRIEKKLKEIDYTDLPFDLGMFFKRHRSEISARFNIDYNTQIEKAKSWDKKERAILNKVNYWFLINLLENFLQHLALIKDLDGKRVTIKPEEFQKELEIDTIVAFLTQQDWIDFDFKGFILYVNNLLKDSAFLKQGEYNNNEAYFMLPANKIKEFWNWNLNLMSSYKKALGPEESDYSKEFIHLNWRNISSGEKAMLDLLSRIYFAIQNISEKDENIDFLFLLIDEGEHGFHPRWQKEYIKSLTSFLVNAAPDKKIQLIISTHSPIIVSDLPKANINFLKRIDNYKSELSSLEKHDESFGANIHSLYSDAFFIDDGLIGEFSKQKILSWFTEINDAASNTLSKSEEEKFKKYLELIGEPLLKKRLLDLLNTKSVIEKSEEKIARLKKEIEEIEKEMKK